MEEDLSTRRNALTSIVLMKESWYGQKVYCCRGSIGALCAAVPRFTRQPFSLAGQNEVKVSPTTANIYCDMIIREPLSEQFVQALVKGKEQTRENELEFGRVPVGVVSRKYELIQHHEILSLLEAGLIGAGLDALWDDAEMLLSHYGERMLFSMRLTAHGFDPGDGYPLTVKVNCLNSVDKSTALEIDFSWFRQVCSNGMKVGGDANLRKLHLRSLCKEDVAAYLKEQFAQLPEEREHYNRWLETRVELDALHRWADNELAGRWGKNAAARACHIARTGWDGTVQNDRANILPHRRKVVSEQQVPGACAPVQNAFHVSQVLSWLARQRRTIQDQHEKMAEIAGLVDALAEMLLHPE